MQHSELLKLVTDFREGILDGKPSVRMCFAVCAPLSSYLDFVGVENELIEGEAGDMQHFWIKLPDGNIIDPTADQFFLLWGCNKMPPVYIGPQTDLYGNINNEN
jgi:hypothetical protein